MLTLHKELLIGSGRDRDCYRHPSDESLCLKVAKRKEKQTKREIVCFRILNLQNKDLRYLSQYRGKTSTNLGPAYCFDLVRNSDGSISKTLTQSITDKDLTPQNLQPLLESLWEYLYNNAICIRDLSPNNVVLKKENSNYKLIIIDGVSNPGINPLTYIIPTLIRKSLSKKWLKFLRKIKLAQSKSQLD